MDGEHNVFRIHVTELGMAITYILNTVCSPCLSEQGQFSLCPCRVFQPAHITYLAPYIGAYATVSALCRCWLCKDTEGQFGINMWTGEGPVSVTGAFARDAYASRAFPQGLPGQAHR